MKTADEMREVVVAGIGTVFSDYPVVVQQSPEDSTTLWVQVFAVPTEKVKEVRQFILGMQDEVLVESDVILLPMVKNLAVTREHYPQYAPRDPTAMLAGVGRFFDERQGERYAVCGGVIVTTFCPSMSAIEREYLRYGAPHGTVLTAQSANKAVAADSELALAA